ncbi:DUF2237 family protein [Litorimonas sp. RW-G-Af-16]|uniref:DUF2237 family protein n=1 Tax=Litorimonas sp. RW-G-Af-16 TaxID=3241168 RepID=UPI00390C59BE
MTSKFGTLNILGEALQPCSKDPMTGFFRDGCCETGPQDRGRHIVCAIMTAEFLAFSKAQGNDLSTPMPHYQFPGLKPGDQWCLCLERWKEAHAAGFAPKVKLDATHQIALERVPLETFKAFAAK